MNPALVVELSNIQELAQIVMSAPTGHNLVSRPEAVFADGQSVIMRRDETARRAAFEELKQTPLGRDVGAKGLAHSTNHAPAASKSNQALYDRRYQRLLSVSPGARRMMSRNNLRGYAPQQSMGPAPSPSAASRSPFDRRQGLRYLKALQIIRDQALHTVVPMGPSVIGAIARMHAAQLVAMRPSFHRKQRQASATYG